MSITNLFAHQKKERERMNRRLIALDIELLMSQPVVFPSVHPTLANVNATMQLPEEKVTLKLPVIHNY